MASTINAQTMPFAAIIQSADSTGNLAFQTANVTALTINSSQVVSLTNALPVASGGTGATSNSAAPFALKGANSDITSLSGLTTALSVAQGGTGSASLTANNVILGNGTSAVQVVAPSTSGNILTSNGTTWISQAPAGGGVTSLNGNTGALSGWQLVTSSTFSASTAVNITGLPTGYRAFRIDFQYGISGSADIQLRYSTNNGSSYVSTATYQTAGMDNIGGTPSYYQGDSYTSAFIQSPITTTTGSINSAIIELVQPANSRSAFQNVQSVRTNLGAGSAMIFLGSTNYNTTTYINAIQAVRLSGTGTITGAYTIYGSK
jgi:hypothetical protein